MELIFESLNDKSLNSIHCPYSAVMECYDKIKLINESNTQDISILRKGYNNIVKIIKTIVAKIKEFITKFRKEGKTGNANDDNIKGIGYNKPKYTEANFKYATSDEIQVPDIIPKRNITNIGDISSWLIDDIRDGKIDKSVPFWLKPEVDKLLFKFLFKSPGNDGYDITDIHDKYVNKTRKEVEDGLETYKNLLDRMASVCKLNDTLLSTIDSPNYNADYTRDELLIIIKCDNSIVAHLTRLSTLLMRMMKASAVK